MDLTPYVDNLRRELAVAAEAGGEDARALAERLTAPLESAVRLTLLDALSAAADEITRDLAPGSVEVRLRGREPDFVVTAAAGRRAGRAGRRAAWRPRRRSADEGGTARINLRLPEHLKGGVEEAASRERPLGQRLARPRRSPPRSSTTTEPPRPRAAASGQPFTGWVR